MLALIAGRGDLPKAVALAQSVRPLVCAVDGFAPNDLVVDFRFPIEKLGGLLRFLKAQGVTQVCLCGGIDRPSFAITRMDIWTVPLVPILLRALKLGDDGALRAVIEVFESRGITVRAAHDLAPGLLPKAGILTKTQPDPQTIGDVAAGDQEIREMGRKDLGQACLIRDGKVVQREVDSGTDAMMAMDADAALGAVFYKAPKPQQDRRVDLPTIGLDTAKRAVQMGLRGLVIEAGGVIVLDQEKVIETLDQNGLFLWVREKGAA